MARIICRDPDNPNNFIIFTEGRADIYRDVNGAARLFSPLQQIHVSTIKADGSANPLSGRYDSAPALFIAPSSLKTYDGECRYINQSAEVGDVFVNSQGDGKYGGGVSGGTKLKIPAASSVFYPVYDAREQIYNMASYSADKELVPNFGQRTYGPYHVPGITWAKSALTGAIIGHYTCIAGYGVPPHDAMIRETDITFSVGISSGTSEPSSWGTTTQRATAYNSVVPTFAMEAETSGSGNYLWFRVALSVPTQNYTHLLDRDGYYGEYTWTGPYPVAGFISYGIAGANVSYGETTLSSGGAALAVEVG